MLGLLAGSLTISTPASAVACSVPSTAHPTIQSAIADASCDPITAAPGTYPENLDIDRDVTIAGAGADVTTIDGTGTGRVISLISDTVRTVSITGFTVTGGQGGIVVNGETIATSHVLTLDGVLVTNNSALSNGGGISIGNGPTVTVSDSAIAANSSTGFGGGITASLPTMVTLVNVTISGNSAAGGGGGFATSGPSSLSNVTIVGNTADSDMIDGGRDNGGGIRVQTPTGNATSRNSLIANNIDASTAAEDPDCAGPITTAGHNLIEMVSAGCGFVAGVGDLIGQDPMVASLANNGGPTPTHALLPGSPAIEGGNPAAPGSGGNACAPTDQRGAPRNCDIGAYELVRCAAVPVNRIGTEGPDILTGTPGPDGFLGLAGNDRMTGLGGNDGACGGAGNDRASGGFGKDRLRGEGGKDSLRGGGGKDRLAGGPGKDSCSGGPGRDRATCEKERKVP